MTLIELIERLNNPNSDLVRALKAAKTALKAAVILDRLDWCTGYELSTEKNHNILDEALTLAREAVNIMASSESPAPSDNITYVVMATRPQNGDGALEGPYRTLAEALNCVPLCTAPEPCIVEFPARKVVKVWNLTHWEDPSECSF